ncbi:MAG: AraC family transcriptional regulator [Bacteroidota bacterium]
MIYEQRHMELGGVKVISHFTFTPPLVAASNLDGHGCFIFPINTKGNVYRQEGKTNVKSDEGVLLKCGSYVNKWSNADENKLSEVVILRFYPELIRAAIDRKTLAGAREKAVNRSSAAIVELDLLMMKYLESLFFYFDNPQLISEDIVNLKLTEIILLLIANPQPNEISDLLLNLFETKSFGIKQTVDNNLFENLSVEELASLCGMSVSTFKRNFKQISGESPGQYIKNKRLEAAFRLLTDQNRSISEIAYETGYSDPNYFSKCFQVKYRLSPSDYQKSLSISERND